LVLAALAATLTAGMFEYTLGDSEILMLILLLSALPFSTRSYSKEPDAVAAFPPDTNQAPSPGESELVLEQ
jgi:hypothetical protein